jgi:hypothetical protein
MVAAAESFFQITFGELIDLVAFVCGGVGLIYGLGRKTQAIEDTVTGIQSDVGDLKADISKLNDVIVRLAVQTTRMDMFDKRLDDVARGRVRIVNNNDH